MRTEVYIRIVNDEASIRMLDGLKVPGATVAQLRAPREGTGERWWHWVTPPVALDSDNMDIGIRSLLHRYRVFFPELRKYKGDGADIDLELVAFYEEDTRPEGLYLSSETISLLNELGAALDYDAVPAVFLNSKK